MDTRERPEAMRGAGKRSAGGRPRHRVRIVFELANSFHCGSHLPAPISAITSSVERVLQ
jgi:hypothetical protein